MKVLVCFAVPQEARPFQNLVRGHAGIQVAITGMGLANARRGVADIVRACQPERVFSCGFAGALNSGLRIGDVVFDSAGAPAEIQTKLHSLGAKPAKFFCAKRIAATASEKEELRAKTNADAVEMESEAIQAVCRERGIACVTVRAISDEAGEDLPLDFNQIQRADMSLDFGRLAWSLAKSPGKLGGLWLLQKNCRHAAERLASVVARIILA